MNELVDAFPMLPPWLVWLTWAGLVVGTTGAVITLHRLGGRKSSLVNDCSVALLFIGLAMYLGPLIYLACAMFWRAAVQIYTMSAWR